MSVREIRFQTKKTAKSACIASTRSHQCQGSKETLLFKSGFGSTRFSLGDSIENRQTSVIPINVGRMESSKSALELVSNMPLPQVISVTIVAIRDANHGRSSRQFFLISMKISRSTSVPAAQATLRINPPIYRYLS